ncbi:MAG TPA: helix-turn-helix transcriptional regulator [Chitinophagales bacterium]|nr:helix-turn-helix transcriptional regulator [Chitinophagales bacterium]
MAARIRKIREISGLKQAAVAANLQITQQAYFGLEKSADNAKLTTLRRFCNVMNIELSFLIADDIPVTAENIEKYGRRRYFDIVSDYEQLEQRKAVFNDIVK